MDTRPSWFAAIFTALLVTSAPASADEVVTTTTDANYVTNSGQLLHCVAVDTGRTYCGTARTRYVISGTPDPRCIEGRTWGLDERGVWVSSGCVADFNPVSTDYVNSSGQLVHCVSTASGRSYCGVAGTRYVIAGTPNSSCIEGRTWGLDDRGVWVSSGCIADFSPSSNYVDANGELVHCVATASGRTYCGAAGTRYVIAGAPNPRCTEGDSWGLDGHGVWVSKGCVADFKRSSTDYVTPSGQLVHCVSTASGRTYCGTAGTRYVIAGTADPRCVEGQTWGYDDHGTWVSSGCVADFSLAAASDAGQVIRCDSTGDGRTYCRTETNRHYLLNKIREGDCVEGRTWGVDDHGLWVSGGCHGDFDDQD